MHRTILFSLIAIAWCASAEAEVVTGTVDYPYLGIQLTIPDGWKGGESGEYLLLGSDTEPGIVGLTTSSAKQVDELRTVADAGWQEPGIQMQRSGEFTPVGAEGLGAEFSGQFQGETAKAFIAGIINPHGNSVTVIALTSAEKYGSRQVELVQSIADSMKFALPKEAEHNQEWRDGLAGRRLTYLNSSYSSGSPYYDAQGQTYGSYSAYSSRQTMDLCSNGQFRGRSSSSMSMDTAGADFGGLSRGGGDGSWEVATSDNGEALLRLTYSDSSVSEYRLDYREGKTYLNDTRYFRTTSEVCQ